MPVYGPQQSNLTKPLKNNDFSARSLLLPILMTGVALGAGTAFGKAEDPGDKQLSINTRLNPAYDPQGIRVGDFIFSPSVSNSYKYNDNVYATELNRMHDFIYTVKPELRVRSDFVRHAFDASLYMERGMYRDIKSENYSDYGANMNARFDVTGQTNIPLKLSYTRQHVRRGGPDERTATDPTFYQLFDGSMGLIHEGQRLAMKIITTVQRYIYDNTVGLAGTIDNGDRDRNEYSLYASLGMNSEAIFAPFVYGNILKVDYDRAFDNNNLDRDAMQYEAGVGTIINFSDVTSASFTLGRLHRTAEDPTLSDIGDFTYGVNFKWEPSPLASLLLSGDRTIKESTIDGVSGSIASSLRVNVDYELFPNLIVSPSAGLVERDYQGPAGGRTVTTDAGLQFTYKMNQNLWLTTTYQYTNQDEKEPAPDLTSYKSNLYGVSLKLQF
jgi:hypothetical protein